MLRNGHPHRERDRVPAGERDDEGSYPEDTINYLVDNRLEELSKGIKEFESGSEEEEEEKQSESSTTVSPKEE